MNDEFDDDDDHDDDDGGDDVGDLFPIGAINDSFVITKCTVDW